MFVKMTRVVLMLITASLVLIGCGGGGNASSRSELVELNPLINRTGAGEDYRQSKNSNSSSSSRSSSPSNNNAYASDSSTSYQSDSSTKSNNPTGYYNSNGGGGISAENIGLLALPLAMGTVSDGLEALNKKAREVVNDIKNKKETESSQPELKETKVEAAPEIAPVADQTPISPENIQAGISVQAIQVLSDGSVLETKDLQPILCDQEPKDEFGSDVVQILETTSPE